MDFYSFRDEYSTAKKQDRIQLLVHAHTGEKVEVSPTPIEFYKILMKSVLSREHIKAFGDSVITQYILSNGLKNWYMQGKPYIKIWPQIAAKLMHTRLDVPTKFLNIPFGVFAIRLPMGDDNPFKSQDTPALQSILVIHCDGTNSLSGTKSRQLLVWFDLGHVDYESIIDYHQPTYGYMHLLLDGECSLEESLERSSEIDFVNESGKVNKATPKEFYRAALALSLCTCFFMTNNHEMVCPDIPIRYQEKYNKAKVAGDEKTISDIEKKARKSGMGGYTLGKEIELPRKVRVRDDDHEPTQNGQTWSQRFSHVRSGHLRLQAYGPKMSQRKVIFIEPTVVKPQLPSKPSVGYAIKDSILPKGE